MTLLNIFGEIEDEINSAVQRFGPFHSAHEGLAVLQEEMLELQAEVFHKGGLQDKVAMREEAIQVAAMAVRFVLDVCQEEKP